MGNLTLQKKIITDKNVLSLVTSTYKSYQIPMYSQIYSSYDNLKNNRFSTFQDNLIHTS